MTSKYTVLILIVSCVLTHGKKSFVVVTDTTASMREEINEIKNHIGSVVKSLPSTGEYENYILVPFSDPVVGVPKTSSTPEGLVNFLNGIEVRGGQDCPENSLAAIEKALEISNEKSLIFVFTDAPPKDINKLPFIQRLCLQRNSQVVTFISGGCQDVPINNMNIYNEVSKSCHGAAFHLDVQDLKRAFKYMKEIVSVPWSDIQTHVEFLGRKRFNFNINKYTKDLIIAVSGDLPDIQVKNANEESAAVEKIMETKHSLVIRLLQPPTGEYIAEIYSKGVSIVTFYKWKTLDFFYGFSTLIPKSLNETTRAPIPDTATNLIIELPASGIELVVLELKTDEEKKFVELDVLDEDKRLYAVQTLFKASVPFQITIAGRDKTTQEIIKGTSKLLLPQIKVEPRSKGATVEVIRPESTLVEFMANATLFCKVTGDPKPDIWWEDDEGNRLDSEDAAFELPSTYISYAAFKNVTTNTTVYCKARNVESESSISAEIIVHRDFTFEIIQSPSDMTVEYGTEGKLFCEAKAFPEATIKWYHNDSAIENTENLEIVSDDHMLVIKNMSLDDTGEYKCEIENSIESSSLTATVNISGLEAPSIELTSSESILKPGASIEVECQITKGNPTPEVKWKMELEDVTVDIPEGIIVEDNILKISPAKVEHSGRYKCFANNVVGMDSQELIIEVQYAPIIKNGEENREVNVGDLVQLECDVDAAPHAAVHWTMNQGDVIIPFDDRHSTDDRNTHRFIAQQYDSGTYYCVAENNLGRAERQVTVIILEAPFIEPLDSTSLRARVGSSLQVTCNVLLGRPVPVTRWEFRSPKSSATTVISRLTTSKLDLVLRDISKTDEGYYHCVTENRVGLDSVKFHLTVLQ